MFYNICASGKVSFYPSEVLSFMLYFLYLQWLSLGLKVADLWQNALLQNFFLFFNWVRVYNMKSIVLQIFVYETVRLIRCSMFYTRSLFFYLPYFFLFPLFIYSYLSSIMELCTLFKKNILFMASSDLSHGTQNAGCLVVARSLSCSTWDLSSLTRDWTHIPSSERWILNLGPLENSLKLCTCLIGAIHFFLPSGLDNHCFTLSYRT